MIGNLRGKVIERRISSVLIECGGVGYEVYASSHTLASVSEIGAMVSLCIYTQFLDHKICLYGFAGTDEREIFDLLITVKNVGPSSAIKILSSGTDPISIARLIAAREVKSLTAIKGIGKKTSEMLVVELHEKCEALLASWIADGNVVLASSSTVTLSQTTKRLPLESDVILALVQLGFRKPDAEKVVDMLTIESGASLESVMRQALQAMPR